jgi:type VI secretion system protein ImpB
VQITYDVYTGGALEKKHLPFVVGVLADLSGQRKEPLKPLKQRDFTMIDRDNFNEVMERAAPRVAVKVPNRLTEDGTQLAVELNFKEFDDFEPDRVAGQVPALRELLEIRQKLTELLARMEGNDQLEQLLGEVLTNTERAKALAQQLQGQGDGAATTSSEAASPAAQETPAPEPEDEPKPESPSEE